MSKFDDKVCVEETLDPRRINVGVGERVSKLMPSTPLMIQMVLVNQLVEVEAESDGMIQLFKNDKPFGTKVSAYTAGLMWDEELNCYYFYEGE